MNKCFEILKNNVERAEESILILDYPSNYNNNTIIDEHYKLYYDKFIMKYTSVLKNPPFIRYNRFLQIPSKLYKSFPTEDNVKLIKLVLESFSERTINHIVDCFKVNGEKFNLFIVPEVFPFSIMIIDEGTILHKLDRHIEGVQELNELYINTSEKVVQHNLQILQNMEKERKKITKKDFIEIIRIIKKEKDELLRKKQEEFFNYSKKIEANQIELSKAVKNKIISLEGNQVNTKELKIKFKEISADNIKNVSLLEKVKEKIEKEIYDKEKIISVQKKISNN